MSMLESNDYLKVEILMEDQVVVYHYERLTTNETITFNNFIAKFSRDNEGFITVNEQYTTTSININKIIKISPQGTFKF